MTAIGVLCLDTSYTTVPGHIRNPATFGFPVACKVVQGATADRVVRQADPGPSEPFVSAARQLEAEGVAAITSACGFLALFQRELAAAVAVPLYASSLIQLPMVRPGQQVGLLTASATSLTSRHLAGVGAESVPVRVGGMDAQPEFSSPPAIPTTPYDHASVSKAQLSPLERASPPPAASLMPSQASHRSSGGAGCRPPATRPASLVTAGSEMIRNAWLRRAVRVRTALRHRCMASARRQATLPCHHQRYLPGLTGMSADGRVQG